MLNISYHTRRQLGETLAQNSNIYVKNEDINDKRHGMAST